MEWELSQHAATVIAERRISLAWVQQTLNAPERVERRADGTWHYLSQITENGDRVLRVVLNQDVEPVRVITVFFDRRMSGQL